MRLALPLLLSTLAIAGCGGADTTGIDGGADGSSSDATTSDGTVSDGPIDAPKDAKINPDAGAACDIQADNCGPGLKCCGGGAQQLDGGVGHCVVPTDAGTCPLIP